MQIVIDIPEEYRENLLKNHRFSSEEIPIVSLAIATGKPLPKGHGKLFDENELKKEAIRCEWSRNMYDKLDHTLSYMKPVLEADTESRC